MGGRTTISSCLCGRSVVSLPAWLANYLSEEFERYELVPIRTGRTTMRVQPVKNRRRGKALQRLKNVAKRNPRTHKIEFTEVQFHPIWATTFATQEVDAVPKFINGKWVIDITMPESPKALRKARTYQRKAKEAEITSDIFRQVAFEPEAEAAPQPAFRQPTVWQRMRGWWAS